MDLINILLIALSVFFALNMGGSGMAPSFSVAIGANIIKRRYAVILFTVFVCFGSLVFGKFVVKTLGSDLVPAENLDPLTVLIVIFSASSSLFLANILKIPQSTSWVTVFAISAVGIYHSSLKTGTLLYKLLPAWILLPLFSFLLTLGILKAFYPLRAWNFRFYEYLSKHEFKMKIFVIAGSCYVAFAIGSNNVANIVGPLSSANLISPLAGLALASPLFGIGGMLFRSPSETVGKEIVPLGLFTATIIKFVFGSLLIFASWLGIPQSVVQLSAFSIIAVSLGKDGSAHVREHRVIRKMMMLWLITPMIASGLAILLLGIFT